MTKPWLTLIGVGEDGVLPPAARRALLSAQAVYGGARHHALIGAVPGEAIAWPTPMAAAYPGLLARRGTPTAVLASGDPMWFGIGATLARLLPWDEIACLPAPSSLALACARLGWAAQDVAAVSLCGRPVQGVLAALCPGRRVIALSADGSTPAEMSALLTAHGFGRSRLHVMEALGGPDERVRSFQAEAGVPGGVHPLNLIAIEADGPRRPLLPGLPDDAFASDGQLTKREVRAITLAALAPGAGDVLWDVGAGSGSVGIEWMRCDPANRAIAVEHRADRAARVAANAAALGVPGLRVIAGAAPAALADLPTPDAVFIGGGAPGSLDACWAALRPGGRLVVNAVTVETEAALLARRAEWGGTLSRLGIERLDAVGGFHAFRPAMTVTQYAVTK